MRLDASPQIPTLPLSWGASLSSVYLHTCHLCPEFGVLTRSEALRQQICDLVVCRYVSQFNGFFFDFVSEPVVFDVEVLGSFSQTRGSGASRPGHLVFHRSPLLFWPRGRL